MQYTLQVRGGQIVAMGQIQVTKGFYPACGRHPPQPYLAQAWEAALAVVCATSPAACSVAAGWGWYNHWTQLPSGPHSGSSLCLAASVTTAAVWAPWLICLIPTSWGAEWNGWVGSPWSLHSCLGLLQARCARLGRRDGTAGRRGAASGSKTGRWVQDWGWGQDHMVVTGQG